MKWTRQFVISSIKVPAYLSIMLLIIHIINVLLGMQLSAFGIYPRSFESLPGVLTAPLIHGDFNHLFSNIVPLFSMVMVMLLFYPKVAVRSLIFIYVSTGLAVWLFARSVFHIGASGVVYGLISFVFWLGVFRKSTKSIVLSLIMVMMYGGYVAGLSPHQPGISWESHLFGAIMGLVAAYLFKAQVEEDEKPKVYDWELETESTDPYLPNDIFQKTKEERTREDYLNYWKQDDTLHP